MTSKTKQICWTVFIKRDRTEYESGRSTEVARVSSRAKCLSLLAPLGVAWKFSTKSETRMFLTCMVGCVISVLCSPVPLIEALICVIRSRANHSKFPAHPLKNHICTRWMSSFILVATCAEKRIAWTGLSRGIHGLFSNSNFTQLYTTCQIRSVLHGQSSVLSANK